MRFKWLRFPPRVRVVTEPVHCMAPEDVDALLNSGASRDLSLVGKRDAVTAVLFLLATIGVGIIGLWRRRGRWLGPPPAGRPDRTDWLVALLLVVGALAIFGPGLVHMQATGFNGTADGEIYASAFWNALNGRGLYNAYEGMDHLGSHASPGLYLLVPFYALAPGPEAIAVINTVQLFSAIAPVYLLARCRLDRLSAVMLALLLLSFPGMVGLTREIHAVKSALPLFLWALCFLEWRRPVAFVGCLLVAASFKENTGIVLLGLGAFLVLARDTRWAGAFVGLLGVTVYFVGAYVIVPAHFGGALGGSMASYDQFGGGLTGLMSAPFRHPDLLWAQITARESLLYVAVVFGSFALLPLAAPRQMLVMLPILAKNVLSAKIELRSMNFHYDALLLPGLIFAAVYGLARVRGPHLRVPILVAAGVAGVAGVSAMNISPLSGEPDAVIPAPAADDLRPYVPIGASLAAPNGIAAQLPRRVYLDRYDALGGVANRALPEYVIVPTEVALDGTDPRLAEAYESIYSNDDYTVLWDTRPPEERCPEATFRAAP